MAKIAQKSTQKSTKRPSAKAGAEVARAKLPSLIEAAERGHSTVITRRGRAVAALVPMGSLSNVSKQQSLLSVAGSGRGLWGTDSTRTVRKLRKEWNQ